MSKKILVAVPAQGGPRTLGEDIVQTFKLLGHAPVTFDFAKYLEYFGGLSRGDGTLALDLVNQSLVVKALEVRADLVLVMAQAPVTPFAVRMLKNARITTAHYFCEDLRAAEHWKPVAGAYDHFFVIQKGEWLAQLRQGHQQSTHYLPHGAPAHIGPPQGDRQYGVVFAGTPAQNRITFFDKLSQLEVDFSIFGAGWDNAPLSETLRARVVEGSRWLSAAEIRDIYKQAGIVINLHATPAGQEIDPAGDVVNPAAFVIPVCGALQLADRRAALRDFFEEDRDIACFSSLDELCDKVRYYLDRPQEAARIAANAYQKVKSAHLLTHRMAGLIDTVSGGPGGAKGSLPGLINLAKSKIHSGAPLDDDDLIHLLAEDILVRQSVLEEAHG
jgi:spore maturation protein CgeB